VAGVAAPTVEHDVPLSALTTLRVGGPADTLVTARSEDEVVATVLDADAAGTPVLVVGGGSNLLVGDDGFRGVVVRIATTGVRREGGGRLVVAAGHDWDAFVAETVDARLAGVEALSGIPGSTGATPVQNVGAYGQEVAETLRSVRVLDRAAREVVELTAAECGFGYRASRFKRNPRFVVLAVTFELDESGLGRPVRYAELARTLAVPVGARAPLREVREAVLTLRRGKGMVLDPTDPDTVSAGSFFTNPVLDAGRFAALRERAVARGLPEPPAWPDGSGVKTSAAWLSERAGFAKGYGGPRAR
jgi:UDP-N-acetylmuramate dehydrogenase